MSNCAQKAQFTAIEETKAGQYIANMISSIEFHAKQMHS